MNNAAVIGARDLEFNQGAINAVPAPDQININALYEPSMSALLVRNDDVSPLAIPHSSKVRAMNLQTQPTEEYKAPSEETAWSRVKKAARTARDGWRR